MAAAHAAAAADAQLEELTQAMDPDKPTGWVQLHGHPAAASGAEGMPQLALQSPDTDQQRLKQPHKALACTKLLCLRCAQPALLPAAHTRGALPHQRPAAAALPGATA